MHPTDKAWLYRVKAATRDLIALCGALDRAATIADVSVSHLSRWQSTKSPDCITIPAALALQEDAGVHLVTEAMADVQGLRVMSAPGPHQPAADVMRLVGDLARETGELVMDTSIAVSDGSFSPTEAERTDRKLAEIDARLRPIRAATAAAKAQGGVVIGIGKGAVDKGRA